jgi:hypothetical protein
MASLISQTYDLKYAWEQGPPWEANSQEISRLLWNPLVCYRDHKSAPLDLIPSQMNRVWVQNPTILFLNLSSASLQEHAVYQVLTILTRVFCRLPRSTADGRTVIFKIGLLPNPCLLTVAFDSIKSTQLKQPLKIAQWSISYLRNLMAFTLQYYSHGD